VGIRRASRTAGLFFALALGSLALSAAASADTATTLLLSRSYTGAIPNAPSRNGAISHDGRFARIAAFESDATDIVATPTNGTTNVYVVPRAEPIGSSTSWFPGEAQLASTGMGGAVADGPSYLPALDGDSRHAPTCLAFVSAATNLVPGDTNGKPDAFLRNLATGAITRVSVDRAGRQANGSTYEVTVDGQCRRVAFVSDATNLALTKTKVAAWKSTRTTAPQPGTRQVYVRVIGGTSQLDKALHGLTFLASALGGKGTALAFASTAGNLGPAGAARPQVYHLGLKRRYGTLPARKALKPTCSSKRRKNCRKPTCTRKVRKNCTHRKASHAVARHRLQDLALTLRLVSAVPPGSGRGQAGGNGPSSHPSINASGSQVAFETLATDLLAGDTHGVSQIVRADMSSTVPRPTWFSQSIETGALGDAPSNDPAITDAGHAVLYDTLAAGLKSFDDPNPGREIVLSNLLYTESRDTDNQYLQGDSMRPVVSAYNNYILFESATPTIDRPMAQRFFPELLASLQRARDAQSAPRFLQVYLRYAGPQ
jgi:hypothetical protein